MSLESPTGQVGQTHSLGMLDSILCVDITLLDVSFLIITRVGITCLASQGGGGGAVIIKLVGIKRSRSFLYGVSNFSPVRGR